MLTCGWFDDIRLLNNYREVIEMGESVVAAIKGWSWLENNYPLPEGMVARLNIVNEPILFDDGRVVNAFAEVSGAAEAEVTVYLGTRPLREIANCLAHEYRHCVQFLAENSRPNGLLDLRFEAVACSFAAEVRKPLTKYIS